MAKNCTDYEGEMEVIYTKGNDGKYKELYVVFTYMYYSYMQLKISRNSLSSIINAKC